MRTRLIVLWMLLCPLGSATAQVSAEVWLPGVSIGINMPVYPDLVRVPGYPVYYAPQVNSNYFFYDGLYWVYQRDNWYRSSWYNGPWWIVPPETVPLFILRVPVRYYRHAPTYFHAWRSDAPPHWGEYWGGTWEKQRRGWDTWNRNSAPAPAPLPAYQRQYSGSRYPGIEQQYAVQSQNYRYQPRDAVVQQHYEAQRLKSAPANAAAPNSRPAPQGTPAQATPPPQNPRNASRPVTPPQSAPPSQPGQQGQQQQGQERAQKSPNQQAPAKANRPPVEQQQQNPPQQQQKPQKQQQQPQGQPQQAPQGQPQQQQKPQKQQQQEAQKPQPQQQQGSTQRDKESSGQGKDKEDKRDGERGK